MTLKFLVFKLTLGKSFITIFIISQRAHFYTFIDIYVIFNTLRRTKKLDCKFIDSQCCVFYGRMVQHLVCAPALMYLGDLECNLSVKLLTSTSPHISPCYVYAVAVKV